MNSPAIIAAAEGQFIAGLIIGVLLGLLLGPVLRSWLAWREWVDASTEADLTERFLARWEREESRSDDRPLESEGREVAHHLRSRQGLAASPGCRPTPSAHGEGSPL
jgi:hypothetical protein